MTRLSRRLAALEARLKPGEPGGVLEFHYPLTAGSPWASLPPCDIHEGCRVDRTTWEGPGGVTIVRDVPYLGV
jgi:hypothetical protein